MTSISKAMTPTEAWQTLLAYLFQQHYGLTINDTPFSERHVIQEHIDAGISLTDAVNFQVERYALIRTDRDGFSWEEPHLNVVDVLVHGEPLAYNVRLQWRSEVLNYPV